MKNFIIILFFLIISVFITNSANAAILIAPTAGSCSSEDCQKNQEELIKKQKEAEELNRTYQERKKELEQYSEFFDDVDVDLSLKTSEYQYKIWKQELIKAKNIHKSEKEKEEKKLQELIEKEKEEKIQKELEAQLKIRELENRIKQLESLKENDDNKILKTDNQIQPVSFPENTNNKHTPNISADEAIQISDETKPRQDSFEVDSNRKDKIKESESSDKNEIEGTSDLLDNEELNKDKELLPNIFSRFINWFISKW